MDERMDRWMEKWMDEYKDSKNPVFIRYINSLISRSHCLLSRLMSIETVIFLPKLVTVVIILIIGKKAKQVVKTLCFHIHTTNYTSN
jgi:hypothetical protein